MLVYKLPTVKRSAHIRHTRHSSYINPVKWFASINPIKWFAVRSSQACMILNEFQHTVLLLYDKANSQYDLTKTLGTLGNLLFL